MKKNIIWKSIKDYEILYEVNNLGQIRNIKTKKILKSFRTKKGYLSCKLSKNGKVKQYYIHRILANEFIPNYNKEKIFINHINGMKTDNRIENLEWCTNKENINHAFDTGLRNISNIKHKTVNQYDLSGNLIKNWYSITNASKSLHITHESISACCHGKRKTAGGYIWRGGDDL